MKSKYDAIIFDFDYTLADSSRGAIECIKYALNKLNKSEVKDELARKTIGLSLKDTYSYLTGDISVERQEIFSSLFIERADTVMADLTEVFKDVDEVITVLKEHVKIGIVSTKFRYRIEEILKREKMYKLFDVIIGGEDVEEHKPNPEGLLKAIELIGSRKENILYVGDSITDAKTAINAGVEFIAMLTGITQKEQFLDYDIKNYAKNIHELYEHILD